MVNLDSIVIIQNWLRRCNGRQIILRGDAPFGSVPHLELLFQIVQFIHRRSRKMRRSGPASQISRAYWCPSKMACCSERGLNASPMISTRIPLSFSGVLSTSTCACDLRRVYPCGGVCETVRARPGGGLTGSGLCPLSGRGQDRARSRREHAHLTAQRFQRRRRQYSTNANNIPSTLSSTMVLGSGLDTLSV